MAEHRPSGRLAVILHADIADSTKLVQRDEHLAHERIQATFRRLSDAISRYHGRVHELRGDALLAEFRRASDAVTAALAFQADQVELVERLDDHIRPVARVGISMGEVVIADGTVTGAGVVLAQRVEQLAKPGGVCITAAIHESLPQRMPFRQESLGERQLKGFDEPVRVYGIELTPGESIPSPPKGDASQRPSASRILSVSMSVVALVVAAGVLLWLEPWAAKEGEMPSSDEVLALPDKPSIAVLPFDNLSDDKSQEYFVDGLTDDLITDLSKLSGLFVIARNSVFTYKGSPVRIEEVARDLGVRYVVEGSVRRLGDRIRVNAQLIEGSTGHHIWAERYDREITDLFTVQDELIGRIVSALALQLTQSEEIQLAHRPAPQFEAYELYLQAREGYYSRDQARMRESLELYSRATEIDPTFAKAYAGIALLAADIWLFSSVRELLGGGVAQKLAEDAAMKAIELDPSLPESHSVLALLELERGEHEAALQSSRRAVELEPNSVHAHATLAIVQGYAGQPEAALESIRTAVRLDPRPPTYLTAYYGWILFQNRKYEDAIAVLEPIAETRDRGLADSPSELLGMAYAELGLMDEARAQVKNLLIKEPFLNVAYYRLTYDHHAREVDLRHRLDALRKAGMPEWPLGYRGDPANRVTGTALEDLIAGKTWSGMDAGRRQSFIQELGRNGTSVYAGATALLSGEAFIKGDELCERYQGFIRGRELCGPVYREVGGNSAGHEEYVYVNPATVRYFSLEQ